MRHPNTNVRGAVTLAISALFSLMPSVSTVALGQQRGLEPSDLIEQLQPNYVKRLLPPFEGTREQPHLNAEWSQFPVKVVVLEDKLLTAERYSAIKRSLERWVKATGEVPGGGVGFSCRRSRNPIGAQILIHLQPFEEIAPWEALTLPQEPYWQYMRLAITDKAGQSVAIDRLERVATHEIGHALGIAGHSPDSKDTMSLSDTGAEVSVADVNTLRVAYGGRLRRG